MDAFERARRSWKVAEQMLTKTYVVVDDPKLILAAAGDIHAALVSCMEAVAGEEEDFERQFSAFREITLKHGFKDKDFELISTINNIIQEHKESPVEFARKDKFVICDEKYNLEAISLADMKNYLFEASILLDKVEAILNK